MVARSSSSRGVPVWVLLLLAAFVLFLAAGATACGNAASPGTTALSGAGGTSTTPSETVTAVPGTITASVSAVAGQNGKIVSVAVYDFDWEPGAPNTQVALLYMPITSDDFSARAVANSVGADGSPTGQPASLQPGTYSVVFYIVAQGQAPEKFAEVRATVAGDIQVSAPSWGSW